jgi:hypothetical protein
MHCGLERFVRSPGPPPQGQHSGRPKDVRNRTVERTESALALCYRKFRRHLYGELKNRVVRRIPAPELRTHLSFAACRCVTNQIALVAGPNLGRDTMKLTTIQTLGGGAVLIFAAMIGGCIVGDQLTTLTIYHDGSADLVTVQSNVHSSETGAKADEELQRYVEEFNLKKSADHVRIAESGGQVQESRWIRSDPPCANLIVARLPTAVALENAFTFKGDHGESLVTAQFTREGTRRKFTLLVTLPPDQVAGSSTEHSIQELRTSQANGLAETRIAVAGGRIVNTRGFTVASDKQSALLEPKAVLELLRKQPQIEVFLEWEVADK